jgi:hypothetical protein
VSPFPPDRGGPRDPRAQRQDEKGSLLACLPHAYGVWHAWTDCAVIRICYEDFSAGSRDVAGLHGRAERCARGVTVYLLPGLTTGQRRAVIRRLRQEASRGFGPPLPQPQLAIALGLDRIRTAARMARAIIRLHPAATVVPGAFVVAVMTLFVIASADVPDAVSGTGSGLAPAAAVSGGAVRAVTAKPGRARVPLVTVAAGADRSRLGGIGLGAGRRTRAKHAHRKHHALRLSVQSGAWYLCQQGAIAPRLWPHPGQPACRSCGRRPAPYTAHFPGPRDLAR